MSDSLQPHESQHARPACPSPTTGVHSDSPPSSRWCHPAISSSVAPFFSCHYFFQYPEMYFLLGRDSAGRQHKLHIMSLKEFYCDTFLKEFYLVLGHFTELMLLLFEFYKNSMGQQSWGRKPHLQEEINLKCLDQSNMIASGIWILQA